MAYDLTGKDYTPPDLIAKVTGSAKYSEDIRIPGMLFCRLLTSPMPHARVVRIDASDALAMEGVVAVLMADEVPRLSGVERQILTNTPHYVGEPILAVAAVDEKIAENAIAAIRIEFERLPFSVDPLSSLHPEGTEARVDGNVPSASLVEGALDNDAVDPGVRRLHWSAEQFR